MKRFKKKYNNPKYIKILKLLRFFLPVAASFHGNSLALESFNTFSLAHWHIISPESASIRMSDGMPRTPNLEDNWFFHNQTDIELLTFDVVFKKIQKTNFFFSFRKSQGQPGHIFVIIHERIFIII